MTKRKNLPVSMPKWKRRTIDTLFVAEYDDKSGAYCVFGVDTGKAYASYASREEAIQECCRLNREKNFH